MAAVALAALAALVLAVLYPSLLLVLALVGAVAALTFSRPDLALVLAVGLFALEGTIKVRLSVENVPSALGVSAALLDVALLAAIAGLAVQVGPRRLAGAWGAAGRVERAGFVLLGLWLVLSIVQVPVSGDPVAGLEGFRLSQGYVAAGLAAGALLSAAAAGRDLGRPVLGGLALVAAYAALRALIGPSAGEEAFALKGSDTPQAFGDAFRTVGSFSGAFGLASYLVPAAVLVFAMGLSRPDLRRPAAAVCLLSAVAVVGSYVRAGLVAAAAGLAVVTFLLLLDRGVERKVRVGVAAALAAAFVLVAGGMLVASGVSDQVRERAKAFVDPGSDASAQIRFDTWERTVREAADEPFGSGLGTVGRATGRKDASYTDNSYLKLLREQGFLGLALFAGGLLLLLGGLAARLVRAGPSRRPATLGALGAVCAFLVLFLFAEYIEQPGKVLVWTLLGFATWELLCRAERRAA